MGFVIEPKRVFADPKKVKTIQEWPEELLSRRQARGFPGIAGHYRKLVPNFSEIAHPLFELIKDNTDGV